MIYEKALYYFYEISRIPRTTHNCEKISAYLCDFAQERGLEYTADECCNVVIKKPCATGYESAPAVILQGHTDMVGDKSPDSPHDFLHDALTLIEEDGRLHADKTTLGADDGCAVALMLALLDTKELAAPALECVFTSDEEDGLDGAKALSLDKSHAKFMINLDSEDEGVFTCGCAGGARLDINIPVCRSKVCAEGTEIIIKGLHGGHSAEEIANGRLNAAKLICELLCDISPDAVIEIESGSRDNAIPHFAKALIISDIDKAKDVCCTFEKKCKSSEPYIEIEAHSAGVCSGIGVIAPDDAKIYNFIARLPNGVSLMSESIPGAVDTSDNLGILRLGESLSCTVLARSASEVRKNALCEKIVALSREFGGSAGIRSSYPGWEYRESSALREVMCRTYRDMYDEEAEIVVIHAGLECGIILSKKPELDIVSCGPNTSGIHTYIESLDLASYKRFTGFIAETLKRIK